MLLLSLFCFRNLQVFVFLFFYSHCVTFTGWLFKNFIFDQTFPFIYRSFRFGKLVNGFPLIGYLFTPYPAQMHRSKRRNSPATLNHFPDQSQPRSLIKFSLNPKGNLRNFESARILCFQFATTQQNPKFLSIFSTLCSIQ